MEPGPQASDLPCPVGPARRAWIEARFGWLLDRFGAPAARAGDVVLPAALVPGWDGTPDAAMALFTQLRDRMGLEGEDLRCGLYSEQAMSLPDWAHDGRSRAGTAGHYVRPEPGQPHVVRVNADGLEDGRAVAATLAHEMGHVLLIGQGRLGGDEPDHEPLTDLLTVFLGLGVVNANSVIRERNTGRMSSIRNLGYLRQEEFAYALALLARLRGEERPAWAGALDRDVREWFEESLAFVRARGWGELDQERARVEARSTTVAEFATLRRRAEREERTTSARVPWCLLLVVLLPLLGCLTGIVGPAWRRAATRPLHVVNGSPWPATVTVDGGEAHLVAPHTRGEVVAGEGEHVIVVATDHAMERLDVRMETSWSARSEGARDTAFVVNVHGAAALEVQDVVYGGSLSEGSPPRFLLGETFVAIPDLNDVFTAPPRSLYMSADGPPRHRRVLDWLDSSPRALQRMAEVDLTAARALLERARALRPDDPALRDVDATWKAR